MTAGTAASHRRRPRCTARRAANTVALGQRIGVVLSTSTLSLFFSFPLFTLSSFLSLFSLYSFLRFCRFYEAKVIYTAFTTAFLFTLLLAPAASLASPSINATMEGFTLLELDLLFYPARCIFSAGAAINLRRIARNDLAKRQVKALIKST